MAGRSLSDADPELFDLIEHEKHRQWRGLELIASENFTSRAVLECLGSVLTNRYAEGQPGARYYGGMEFIDAIENLCRDRALKAFNLDPEEWGVNVQPYSGSPANFAVYTALLKPHDRLMGLDLPSGGHLTHGYYTATRKISSVSVYFESLPYRTDDLGYIDYDGLASMAELYRPKLIVSGASAYPRDWDYARLRTICDATGALLMTDMAHISGLVAAGAAASPFEYCDVVTSTTKKSLRGARAVIIFYRKKSRDGQPTDFEERINFAVFPMIQGGPHENAIAGIATQMREVATQEFRDYIAQVVKNCKTLARVMMENGQRLMTDGTDNHLILWDVRMLGLTGSKVEKLLDFASITVNKNTVAGDKSAIAPGGVRIGTPALTSRGLVESDMEQVAQFLLRGAKLCVAIQERVGKKLADFVTAAENDADVAALRADVEAFAKKFPLPGVDVSTMRYTN